MAFSVAKEGFRVMGGTILLSSLMFAAGLSWFALILYLFFLFEICFFRDPDRIPAGCSGGDILSPADGTIIKLEEAKVSIFMSLFDVHINRAPAAGEVQDVHYRRGKFRAAFHEEAPRDNERNTVILKSDRGVISFTQIAGLVARRVVCRVRKGDLVRKGERVGMIKFGSRVDLELPINAKMKVCRGDRVRAGLSIIATVEKGEES